MFGSLVFSLFLVPTVAHGLMRRPRSAESGPHQPFVMHWLLRGYRPLMAFFVRQRGLAVGLGVSLLALDAAVVPFLGSEFTPRLQEGTLVLRLTMAPSISLRESTRVTQIVERRLMKVREIKGVVTRIAVARSVRTRTR
jgi:cobalt-zinc-cadmium resistance protein CzcA